MEFGIFIKEKRKALGLTLREFCRKFGYLPSTISRMENGILPAPAEKSKIDGLAKAFGIEEGSADWVTLFDLASASRKEIPQEIKIDFPEVQRFLPAFFRTARKKDVNEEDIKNLLKLIKSNNDSK